ncbi:MAG: hypothetical protein K8I82_23970, partial [Anaerolineae bacterium]|nr:hypothetical protein [Anaerolineae bacterium]
MSVRRKFVSLLFLIPAFCINSYLALYFYCMDCYPVLAQANNVSHWLLLAGMLLLITGAVLRLSYPTLFLLLPGALVFIFWFLPDLLPEFPNSSDQDGFVFTAATYNTGDEYGDAEEKLHMIQDLDADMIALFEYSGALRSLVEAGLADEYPYQYQYPASYDGEYKQFGFLSRYPIISPPDRIPYPLTPENYQRRRYMRLVVDMNGQPVSVYLFHPVRPPFELGSRYDDSRLRENFELLLAQLNDEMNPTLVLCDCNFTPRSRQYGELDDVLFDSFAEKGWGFGLTSSGLGGAGYDFKIPLVRVDYLWHDIAIEVADIETRGRLGPSDHIPVWGRFQ